MRTTHRISQSTIFLILPFHLSTSTPPSRAPPTIVITETSLFHTSKVINRAVRHVLRKLLLAFLIAFATSIILFALPLSPPPGLPITLITPHSSDPSTRRRKARDQPEISRLGETRHSSSVKRALSSSKCSSGMAASRHIIICSSAGSSRKRGKVRGGLPEVMDEVYCDYGVSS